MGLGDFFWYLGDILSDAKDWAEDRVTDVGLAAMDVGSKIEEIGTGSVEIAKDLSKVVSGQVLADAANDVLNETIGRLNDVNENNKRIVSETNSRIKRTQNEHKQAVHKLVLQKQKVHQEVLKPYIQIMDKLVYDARYTGCRLEIETVDFGLGDLNQQYYASHGKSEITLVSYIAPAIDVVSKLSKSIKMEEEISRAKEENERLKSEKAKVYAKCKSIEQVTEFMNSAYNVVDLLKKQAMVKIGEVRDLVDKKGCTCVNFLDRDIVLLKDCTNTVVLLNSIVNTQLINEKGIINPVYKKYIEEQLKGDERNGRLG